MAAVIIHSDFRAQEKEICHYSQLSPLFLLWGNGARCQDLSFLKYFFIVSGHKELGTSEWLGKEDVVHVYDRILVIKKNEVMPFAPMWIDIEIIILSEIREKQIYDIT